MRGDATDLLCMDRAHVYLHMAEEILEQAHMAYGSAFPQDPETARGIIAAANDVHMLCRSVEKEFRRMKEEME